MQQALLLEQIKHNNRLCASLRDVAIPAIRREEHSEQKEIEERKSQYRRYDKLKKKQSVRSMVSLRETDLLTFVGLSCPRISNAHSC